MSNDKTDPGDGVIDAWIIDATPILEELRGYGTPPRTVNIANLYEAHHGGQSFYDLDAPEEYKPYEVTQQGATSQMSWDEAETRSIAAQTAALVTQWDAEDEARAKRKK